MTERSAMLLLPTPITEAMVATGTSVPVVDSSRGEVAWNIDTPYTGVEEKINCDGRLWASVAASKGVKPGTDTAKWRDMGPSNRMAPYDEVIGTQCVANGELVQVIKPGFCNGLALYGLVGEQLEITQRYASGGEILDEWKSDMFEQAFGLFEYLYMPLRQITKRQLFDLQMAPEAEFTIRITASNNGVCAVGMVVCGFWESLLGSGVYGGVEYGAGADIKTYSYIKEKDGGTVEIRRRASGTNIDCTVVIEADQANRAADLLHRVAGRPVAIVLSGLPRYEYLNTVGLISGRVSPPDGATATVQIKGRGFV